MKLRLPAALFLCLPSLGLFAQVQDAVLLFNKDKKEWEQLEENDARLPQDLQKQVAYFDSIQKEICAGPLSADCKSLKNGTAFIRGKLKGIADKTELSRQSLDSARNAFEVLQSKFNSSQFMLEQEYRHHRKPFAKWSRRCCVQQTDVFQMQKWSVLHAVWYFRKGFKKKDPMAPALIEKYLAKSIREKISVIDSFKKRADSLDNARADLDTIINVLREEKKRLEYERGTLRIVSKETGAYIAKIEEEIKGLEKERSGLERKRNDLQVAKGKALNALNALNAQLDSITNLLALRGDDLDKQSGKIENIQTRLGEASDSLLHINRQRDSIRQELENNIVQLERRKANNLLLVILTILAALAAAFFYARESRRAKRGKAKVERVNAALENANIELRDKGIQLETLIRELHHRTKNNLQEISSMLYLQTADLEDERTKDALNDARGRIDALGIIHRLLYQKNQDKFTTVRIADYVKDLAQHLLRVNDLNGKEVRKHFEVQALSIEMDVAVHLGLVLNELMQNCFKHAFPYTPQPELGVSLRAEGDKLLMTVRDNGPGFSALDRGDEDSTFGLKLVRIIAEGRGGTFDCHNDGGAVFNISIPIHEGEVESAK